MAKKDYYVVLGVPKTAPSDQIKKAFRALAREFHPDHNNSQKAEERFKEIGEAYEVLSDPTKRERYDKHGHSGPIIIQTKKDKYVIDGVPIAGDLADVYQAKNSKGDDVAFKIVRDPKNNDLLENEWKMLNLVRPLDKKEEEHFRFFPTPIESLKISADGKQRQTNIMTWAAGHHTLEKVRSASHGELQIAHGIWMFRRLLSALSWVNQGKKIVHGALVPTNIMVFSGTGSIYDHGAKLLDWSYAVPVGEKIKAIVPQYEAFYPPEVFQKKPVNGSSDLYMAAKCIIYVLGGDPHTDHADTYPAHVPPYLKNFLRGCTLKTMSSRPQDAYELLKEFSNNMDKNFGPRKYVQFSL